MASANNDLSERFIRFSASVVRFVSNLASNTPSKRIGDQLLRSATSAGANFEECRGTFSRADFCNRLQISLKEMRETLYWLRVIQESGISEATLDLAALVDEAAQLRAILGKSTVTARARTNREAEAPNRKT